MSNKDKLQAIKDYEDTLAAERQELADEQAAQQLVSADAADANPAPAMPGIEGEP